MSHGYSQSANGRLQPGPRARATAIVHKQVDEKGMARAIVHEHVDENYESIVPEVNEEYDHSYGCGYDYDSGRSNDVVGAKDIVHEDDDEKYDSNVQGTVHEVHVNNNRTDGGYKENENENYKGSGSDIDHEREYIDGTNGYEENENENHDPILELMHQKQMMDNMYSSLSESAKSPLDPKKIEKLGELFVAYKDALNQFYRLSEQLNANCQDHDVITYWEKQVEGAFRQACDWMPQSLVNLFGDLYSEWAKSLKDPMKLMELLDAYQEALNVFYTLYDQHIAGWQPHDAIQYSEKQVKESFRQACELIQPILLYLCFRLASESAPLILWDLLNAYKKALDVFFCLDDKFFEKFGEHCPNPPVVAIRVYEEQVQAAIKKNPEGTEGFAKVVGDLLRKFLDWPKGREAFGCFLQSEFSKENLDFVSEVETYKSLFSSEDRKAASDLANEIVAKYITANVINLPSKISAELQEAPQDPIDVHHFDAAEQEIWKLMKHDSFRRFKLHEDYRDVWLKFLQTEWREFLMKNLFLSTEQKKKKNFWTKN